MIRSRRVLMVLLAATVAACTPQDLARDISQRTAATVVYSVVNQMMPGPQAQIATDCIVGGASQAQLEALMRDVGTRAGTDTVRNVQSIAALPDVQSCLAAQGLPGLAV